MWSTQEVLSLLGDTLDVKLEKTGVKVEFQCRSTHCLVKLGIA